jgi:hypothetical protein
VLEFRKIMFIFHRYLLCVLIVIASFSTVNAQDRLKAGTFTSLKGLFSIEIPFDRMGNTSGMLKREDALSLGEGYLNSWSTRNITLRVDFIDFSKNTEVAKMTEKQLLQNVTFSYEDNLSSNSSNTNIVSKSISLNEMEGKEVSYDKSQTRIILRFFAKNRTLYRLITIFEDSDNGLLAEKFLASFRIISLEQAIQNKILSATPNELPQTSNFRKAKTDIDDEGLKGNVKSLAEEIETTRKDDGLLSREKTNEKFYSTQGWLIKEISYDFFDGFPVSVQVYGFIDDMRVSNIGFIQGETTIRGIMAFVPKNKPDNRYSGRYEYKYDENNRLKEKLLYRNDGELMNKNTFDYAENKIEESQFKGEKLQSKRVGFYGKQHLVKDEIVTRFSNNKIDENKFSYKYESLDKKGNWTKQIKLIQKSENGKEFYHPIYTVYRTITYYE